MPIFPGVIPSWLNGKFMRIGPGVFDWGNGFTVNYFFDGMAVICKIQIKNGNVRYVLLRLDTCSIYYVCTYSQRAAAAVK